MGLVLLLAGANSHLLYLPLDYRHYADAGLVLLLDLLFVFWAVERLKLVHIEVAVGVKVEVIHLVNGEQQKVLGVSLMEPLGVFRKLLRFLKCLAIQLNIPYFYLVLR